MKFVKSYKLSLGSTNLTFLLLSMDDILFYNMMTRKIEIVVKLEDVKAIKRLRKGIILKIND